jgi:DNA-directed RNA polymerase specialized sigma24 family protein
VPDSYRTVFVLRGVEEMNAVDVVEILNIIPENVKMRLHHARAFLRKRPYLRAEAQSRELSCSKSAGATGLCMSSSRN